MPVFHLRIYREHSFKSRNRAVVSSQEKFRLECAHFRKAFHPRHVLNVFFGRTTRRRPK